MLGGAAVIGRFDWYCRIWFQACLSLVPCPKELLIPCPSGPSEYLLSLAFSKVNDSRQRETKKGSCCVLYNLFVEVMPHCTTCYWSNQVIACIYYTKCVNTKMQGWLRANLEAVYHSHEFICLPLMTLNKSLTLMNFSFLITSPTDELKCDDLIRW